MCDRQRFHRWLSIAEYSRRSALSQTVFLLPHFRSWKSKGNLSGIYSSLLQKAGKLCSGFFSLSTLTPLGPVGCFLPISLRVTLGPEWFAVGFCCCCFPSVALGRCKPGQWSITEPCPLAFCLSGIYVLSGVFGCLFVGGGGCCFILWPSN